MNDPKCIITADDPKEHQRTSTVDGDHSTNFLVGYAASVSRECSYIFSFDMNYCVHQCLCQRLYNN